MAERIQRRRPDWVGRACQCEQQRLGLRMAGRDLVSAVYMVAELLKGGKYDQQLSMLRGYAGRLREEIEHGEHVDAGS